MVMRWRSSLWLISKICEVRMCRESLFRIGDLPRKSSVKTAHELHEEQPSGREQNQRTSSTGLSKMPGFSASSVSTIIFTTDFGVNTSDVFCCGM